MKRAGSPLVLGVAALIAAALAGCALADPQVAERTSSVIYGADDRTEYFDVAAPDMQARMAQSMVALVLKSALGSPEAGYPLAVPSWQDARMLCPGTRFADQPAAAFCTGVLVDWDLVLTAGHCMRAFASQDIAVVFGYYYAAPGVLAVDGVGEISAIVAEAVDPDGVAPRLDYAWLRLKQVARAPHKPAPIHVRMPELAVGDPLVSIGAGGGIPLKLDRGGHVQDPRADVGDYFFADTDTFEGGSGGGAFDTGTALLGILARGGADFALTADGCNQVVQQPDAAAADEQFTYANSAVEALCAGGASPSTICRTDCPSPCEALPPEVSTGGGASGCAVGGSSRSSLVGLSIAAAILLRRARRRARRRERWRLLRPSGRLHRRGRASVRSKLNAQAGPTGTRPASEAGRAPFVGGGVRGRRRPAHEGRVARSERGGRADGRGDGSGRTLRRASRADRARRADPTGPKRPESPTHLDRVPGR